MGSDTEIETNEQEHGDPVMPVSYPDPIITLEGEKTGDEESPPPVPTADAKHVSGDAPPPTPTILPKKVDEETSSKEQPAVVKKLEEVDVSKTVPVNTPPSTIPPPPHEESSRTKFVFFFLIMLFIVIVLVIALPLALRDDDDDDIEEIEDPPPPQVEFLTGVSLVTHYAVNATINSRLARTIISIHVMNSLECVSIRGVTLQLPEGARVAKVDLVDNGINECSVHGKAMELAEARETFMEQASQGMGAAYVEERDSFTYSVQVSMAPFGKTSVEVVVEQLLQQKVGVVDFAVPLVPLQKVDQVFFDLHIDDANPDLQDMNVDFGLIEHIPNTTKFNLELLDAQDYALPLLVRGSFKPSRLPEEGALYTDDNCFEHVFHPSDVQAMPKNIVFLMDISQSMQNRNKLGEAKYALKNLTGSLTAEDTMTIQAFAGRPTEELKGLFFASPEEKDEALQWIDEKLTFRQAGGGTNLFAALGQALLRAETAKNINPGAVTVLVILSDGKPTEGETSVSRIANVMRKLNERVNAKIFSLGFHEASLDLLKAISIMNDGATYTLGPGADYAKEMMDFFESEFGTILVSDVNFTLRGEGVEHTANSFPLLSNGTELVVRGLLPEGVLARDQLAVTVTGHTWGREEQVWTPTAVDDPFITGLPPHNSRCHQSYAHDKITQLLDLALASKIVGDEAVAPLVSLSKECPEDETLEKCIRKDALALALNANLVVSGLTGMVTEDKGSCFAVDNQAEVCVDGTDPSGEAYWDNPWEDDSVGSAGGGSVGGPTSASTSAPAVVISPPAAAPTGGAESDGSRGSGYTYPPAGAPRKMLVWFTLFSTLVSWFMAAW